MTKVFIVFGVRGGYPYKVEYPVRAFFDEEEAHAAEKMLNKMAGRFWGDKFWNAMIGEKPFYYTDECKIAKAN